MTAENLTQSFDAYIIRCFENHEKVSQEVVHDLLQKNSKLKIKVPYLSNRVLGLRALLHVDVPRERISGLLKHEAWKLFWQQPCARLLTYAIRPGETSQAICDYVQEVFVFYWASFRGTFRCHAEEMTTCYRMFYPLPHPMWQTIRPFLNTEEEELLRVHETFHRYGNPVFDADVYLKWNALLGEPFDFDSVYERVKNKKELLAQWPANNLRAIFHKRSANLFRLVVDNDQRWMLCRRLFEKHDYDDGNFKRHTRMLRELDHIESSLIHVYEHVKEITSGTHKRRRGMSNRDWDKTFDLVISHLHSLGYMARSCGTTEDQERYNKMWNSFPDDIKTKNPHTNPTWWVDGTPKYMWPTTISEFITTQVVPYNKKTLTRLLEQITEFIEILNESRYSPEDPTIQKTCKKNNQLIKQLN